MTEVNNAGPDGNDSSFMEVQTLQVTIAVHSSDSASLTLRFSSFQAI
jgi:hypothetical protein